ncbi:cytochrome c oxidase assembly protein [Gordonia rubripertincta]|uniref:cytochrome c oxidase assembly protein n=1 Tax=Gordonia rubripertincta TaxID=36822 RepID=UPI0035B04993
MPVQPARVSISAPARAGGRKSHRRGAYPERVSTPSADSIDIRRSAAASIGWVLAWVAAAVAIAVTAISASKALDLAGVGDPGALTRYGLPTVQTIGEIGAVVAVGGALFAAFFVPPQPDGVLDVGGYRAIRFASVGALVWAVAALLMIPLTISDASGYPLSETLTVDRMTTAFDQVADARSWLWTAIFALICAIVARIALRWTWTLITLPLALLTLMPIAIAGHSSTGGSHDVATNSLILHIVGACLWMGGLFALLAYARGGGQFTALAARRYSRVAFWCFIVVGASGVINALVRVHLDQLFTETYGQLVLAKLAALIVLGGFGAWHRRTTIPALSGADDRKPLVRFAFVELLVFAATFGIAVGLSRTPPPANVNPADMPAAELVLGYRIDEAPTFGALLTDWRFDLLFGTLAIVMAVVYLRGVIRLRRRGDSWPIGRTITWMLGCAALLFATSSGLGKYAPALFSMHMIAHMVLSMLVPVLLVLGGPVTLALRALSPAGRNAPPGPREWILTLLHSPFSRFMTHPLVASVLFVGSYYVLYLGGLFELLADYHAAHVAMNLHFMVSGYLFYWVVIGIDPAPRTLSPVAKLAMVFGSLPFHAFFGVALMSTDNIIARNYYNSLMLPWNPDLMSDQRLGGGIAWAAGEIPLVLVMLALLVQWSRQDQRQAKRFDRREERDDGAELASYNAMLAQLSGRSQTAEQTSAPDEAQTPGQPRSADPADEVAETDVDSSGTRT